MNNLISIGDMKIDFTNKILLKDYEGGFFVPVYENTNDISEHLSLMYKSPHVGYSIICSTGEIYGYNSQLICPVIFNNIT
ncbi:hypothetical protein SDC9_135821 [bioreactor metagenome]|uniref:Uncharacterized protein n=1 Tax=bioreactor metagenome TaxID=1076179 RepID=A0A645DHI4_9ZZZZ